MKRKIVLSLISIILVLYANAQLTSVFTDKDLIFKEAINHFTFNNQDLADNMFNRYTERTKGEISTDLFKMESKLYELIIAFETGKPNAEELLTEFEKYYSSSILMNDAFIAQGNFYFKQKDYHSAMITYEKIDLDGLEYYKEDDVKFKLAYSYFVKRQFDKASYLFKDLSLTNRRYFYPSNYYYGLCMFLNSDFERAINSFSIIQNTEEYKNYIPYYLIQLYFSQGDYDKAIEVGEEKLKMAEVENYYIIHQLVGQSYFQKKDYEKALPHLEIYEKNTEKLTESDFYHLGFLYHLAGKCNDAIRCMSELTNLKTEVGQNANYYIADCYLITGDKESARTAFKNAGSMDFNQFIKEESILNYGKLSSEMGYDREAINALMQITDSSPYYLETQGVLKNIFINTKDYSVAQTTLEELNDVSSYLFEAYQIVSYYKALQEINDGQYDKAEEDLLKAEKISRDINTSIQSQYWLGDLMHKKGDYEQSNKYFDKYFILIKGIENFEELTLPPFAHYIQGYNYYKLKNYPASIQHFQSTVNKFKEFKSVDVKLKNRMTDDAYIRLGDAYFYSRQLKESLNNYNTAIIRKADNSDYALFQKAMIMGLDKKEFEKLAILNDLISNYRSSGIRPLAIFELATTYNDLNQFEKAYDLYSAIIKEYKAETNIANKAFLKMGLLSYNKGDIETSIINYKSALSNNPNAETKKEALLALEEIYVNDKKNTEEFISYLQTFPDVKIEGLYKDSLNFVTARLQFENDSVDGALKSLNNYLDKYDKGYYALDARYYRAESYLRKKNYSMALKDFEFVIAQGFNNFYEPSLYKAAVINFNHLKNYNKALSYYKDLVSIVKDENRKYEVQLGIMRSAFMINDFDNVTNYGNFIINNQLTTDKEKSAAHYYIGKVAESNKKYDTALLHLNKVIKENPNSNLAAESRYLISKVYFNRKELDLSKKMISDASAKNSAYPYWVAKGLILLSDISMQKNDIFNAKAALEAIQENFREDKEILKEVEEKLAIIAGIEATKSRIETESEEGIIKMETPK
jgi:tetratricopeptide (TPR) repeat protein